MNTEITRLQQTIDSKNDELKKQKESLDFECQKRVFSREQELNKEKANEIKVIQDQLTKEVRLRRIQHLAHEIIDEMNLREEQRQFETLRLVIDNLSRVIGDLADPFGDYSPFF